jgi:disulfide bond formation protein DsbB
MTIARWLFLAGFFFCFGLVAYAVYLQTVQGVEPCPLCIIQRIFFLGLGLVCLVAVVHGASGRANRVYGVLMALLALGGGSVAARQVWLQHHPDPAAECGAGLSYLFQNSPLPEFIATVFRGTGDCSEVGWTFLGLSIPEWSLAAFAGLALVGIWQTILARTALPQPG